MITHAKHRIISSAKDQSINFVTDRELESYERELRSLIKKHKRIMRSKYGEWDPQEDAYVAHWPVYYIHSNEEYRQWYIIRNGSTMVHVLKHVTGVREGHPEPWGEYYDNIVQAGVWIAVTEEEAKSLTSYSE